METRGEAQVWRVWVNVEERVVSFHQEEGFQLMEFRSWELFQAAIDQYTRQRYRYQ
ncbi:MAG: hypothetical protein HFG12_10170 [Oscillibacter sp.]|nr:hypothetical protein [uncultured Oscillibacter sp.]MCI8813582.1 hypothetical protein [Oscillibacter sp.]